MEHNKTRSNSTHIESDETKQNAHIPPAMRVVDAEVLLQPRVRAVCGAELAFGCRVRVRKVSAEVLDERVHVLRAGEARGWLEHGKFDGRASDGCVA